MIQHSIWVLQNTYVRLMKECVRMKDIVKGRKVHAGIIMNGLESYVFIQNNLVDMYIKCGSIRYGQDVFDKMCVRNVFSWTIMISAYANHYGHNEDALVLFEQMQREGGRPDEVTFVSVLKVCAGLATLERGKAVHASIKRMGFDEDVFVGSTLVDMYSKCGSLGCAEKVFDAARERDAVLWSAMISACVQHNQGEKALALFEQMQCEGNEPDEVTYAGVLKACADLASLESGKRIHASAVKSSHERNMFVGSALIDMYANCERMEEARRVLSGMPRRDVVSWSAVIAGYARHGRGEEALALLEQMSWEGVKANVITFLSIFKACAGHADLPRAKRAHASLLQNGFDVDVVIGNTLVDMYIKCGSLGDARHLFDKMREQNVVSWNTMIAGYAQYEHGHKEALALFDRMQWEGLKANEVTYISALKACAGLAALEQGKQIHASIKNAGFDLDMLVGNSLLDMYAKCGNIENAQKVFDEMHEHDVVSWSAMIGGYAQHGCGEEALALLEQMQMEGVKPNEATFTSVLSACSRAGLVEKGCRVFSSMRKDFSIKPSAEHCACLIDLLGRTGHLVEAEDFIKKVTIESNVTMWMALLGACRTHGNVQIGRRAFECIVRLDPECTGAYILLSNIYAAAGKWEEAGKLRKEIHAAYASVEPCGSLIKDKDNMHALVGADSIPK